MHPDRFECPDCIIDHSPVFREYGLIIHDGGTSSLSIHFCPWCGAKLPESLRDRWFEELRAMGLDPWEDDIPEAYKSADWWAKAP
jgi:hypothetical protein